MQYSDNRIIEKLLEMKAILIHTYFVFIFNIFPFPLMRPAQECRAFAS